VSAAHVHRRVAAHAHSHSGHHHLLRSITHPIGSAARGIGHAAQHVVTFLHHHAATSIGVAAIVGIVVVATVLRGAMGIVFLRLADWMGVSPRGRSQPPGGAAPS
jgi:hypothetical protein